MRCCLEIASRFGLLVGLFLSVVLFAVGLGAITRNERDAVPGPATAAVRPALVAGLVGARSAWRSAALSAAGLDTDTNTYADAGPKTSHAVETIAHEGPGGEADTSHPVPHVLWSTPFVLLLLAIAVLPLVPVAHHWWERNSIKLLVGLVLSAAVLAHYGWRGYGAHGAAPGGRPSWRSSSTRSSATSCRS